jgi:hypothetical protein
VSGRTPRAAQILDALGRFKDTFTTSLYYETHKILVLERLVDSIVDEATMKSDKVQGYLDAEEQIVRRQIIDDWNRT